MTRKFTYQENLLRWSKKHKNQLTIHTSVLAIILGALLFSSPLWSNLTTTVPIVEKDEDAILTASFVGDMMFGRYIERVINHKGFDHLFRYTDPYFEASDFVTGNFKHPVLLEDREPLEHKNIVFSTTPETVEALKRRNFKSVSLANNNVYDYGYLAFRDTVSFFENDPDIDAAGTMVDRENTDNAVYYEDESGITIATLGVTDIWAKNSAATTFRPGVVPLDPPNIAIESIVKASQNAELVVVHVHWGEPYDSHVSERQRRLAYDMSHAGADIIIGHYPHVLAPVEVYNDTIIFYSLGNFIFDQGWTRTKQTALAQYRLYADGVAEVDLVPFTIREGQPRPVANFSYRRMSIQQMLTKLLPNDRWEVVDGRIRFRINHERILEEPIPFEESI
ncbi:poly-gamma-glutamate synthesis protein (capsule biosynthesis protein) [Evansella vedderi]|uniref:Poly-gamma-glutamate synthesis protein (Capsule biosynthesis protein) n=1 Tax=Evansella vedderi TaxID=38282 RepID=A0ABU0A2K6_9BACI|nr:CapA family protein [Evansella vedderi]MDQ0257232.1 poly-gamma-glutamate synthesis protein (capsule biosynthesis protein) [Evansella vedderi]